MSSVIRLCINCRPHSFQDSRYGLKMRVMNQVKSDPDGPKARCTVYSAVSDLKKEKIEVKTQTA